MRRWSKFYRIVFIYFDLKPFSIAEFVIASGEVRKKVRNRNKFYNISANNSRNRK